MYIPQTGSLTILLEVAPDAPFLVCCFLPI
jgi:hypothetical protein